MKRKNRITLLIAMLLLYGFICALSAADQQANNQQEPTLPPLQYRMEVRLLQVEVFATDKKNDFVTGLTKDDFVLFEDGKKQTIRYVDEVHVAAPSYEKGAPSTAEMVSAPQSLKEINHIIMIFDGCNTSQMGIERIKKAAKDFVFKTSNPKTKMSIYYLDNSGYYHQSREFTDSSADLINTIDSISLGAGGVDAQGARIKQIETSLESVQRCTELTTMTDRRDCVEAIIRQTVNQAKMYGVEEKRNGITTAKSLEAIFQFVRHIPGHKSALLFSEGFDPTGQIYINYLEEAVREAMQSYNLMNDAAIYVKEAKQDLLKDITNVSMIQDLINEANGAGLTVYWLNPQNPDSLLGADSSYKPEVATPAMVSQVMDQLKSLSTDTGGFSMQTGSFFAEYFKKLSRNLTSFYLISYMPERPARDGKIHKIKVEVIKPNIQVQARKSVVDFKLQDQIDVMLASALDFSEYYNQIPIQKEYIYLMDDKKQIKTTISIAVPFSAITPLYEGDNFIDEVHFAYLIKDYKDDIVAKDHKIVSLNLPNSKYNQLAKDNSTFQNLYAFELKPGTYTLYAAVAEAGGWKLTGWKTPLIISLKEKDCFALSPLVIASKVEGVVLPVGSKASHSVLMQSDGTIIYNDQKIIFSATKNLPISGQIVGIYQIFNASSTSQSKAAIQISFKLYDQNNNLISSLPPKEINDFTDFMNKLITNVFKLPYKYLAENNYKLVLEAKDLINKCSAESATFFSVKQQ